MCIRDSIDTLFAMAQRGCGYYSVLSGGVLLFLTVPLLALMLGKVYTYHVSHHYKVTESLALLAKQRMLINMNLGSFGCWALLPWIALCYSVLAGVADSPVEKYLCMYTDHSDTGAPLFLGSAGLLGDPLWTCRYVLIGVPICLYLMISVRDPKEDAAAEAARRAKGGGG
eukprot:TRINITY_DN2420_c0_g1_i4.p1 TRINITY_DN2420_c0_g1~~TRINITY_DN2420_c0_g1_i4.p1  ORF type:complete len:170 (-),score=32.16 TRINITY_DN2420_c0_g1_i4:82-591(-)